VVHDEHQHRADEFAELRREIRELKLMLGDREDKN